MVWIKNELKAIRDVEVGDQVASRDPVTDRPILETVTRSFLTATAPPTASVADHGRYLQSDARPKRQALPRPRSRRPGTGRIVRFALKAPKRRPACTISSTTR